MKIATIMAAAAASLLASVPCGPPAQAAPAKEMQAKDARAKAVPAEEVQAPSGDGTFGRDIAGGSATTFSAAPFAVQVSFVSVGTKVGCTGSQIAAGWVITAKHCNSTSLRSVRLGSSYLGTGGAVRALRGPSVRTRSESGHTLSGDSGGPLIVNGKLAGVLSSSDILPAPNPSNYTGYYNDHASVVRNLAWITSVSGVRGS